MTQQLIPPHIIYNGMRVVVSAQSKGGVGKTTLALHLAIRAALGRIPEVAKKILFIDLDPQQNSSIVLLDMVLDSMSAGIYTPPIHPMYDPVEDVDWDGMSNSVSLYYGENVLPYPSKIAPERLDVLPADGNILLGFEGHFSSQVGDGFNQQEFDNHIHNFFRLQDVQDEYDLVIIDCPPGRNAITKPALRAATDLIVPFNAHQFGQQGTTAIIEGLKKDRLSRKSEINIIGIVPNKVDMRTNMVRASLDELRAGPNGHLTTPFNIREYAEIGHAQFPLKPTSNCKLKNKKAEADLDSYIKWTRSQMYGEGYEKTLASNFFAK